MDVSTIVLEFICPGAGMIFANIMFAAPIQDLQRAVRKGEMGDLNPTPWAFMLGNCFGWVLYGILINNLWVYFANAPGLLMSLWLNLGAVKLLYQKHHSTVMRTSLIQYLQDYQSQPFQQEQVHLSSEVVFDHQPVEEDETVTAVTTSRVIHSQSTSTTTMTPPQPSTTTTTTTTGIIPWAKIVWQVTSQTTPAPTPHERLVMFVTFIWMAVASLVGWIGSTNLLGLDNDNDDDDNDNDPSSRITRPLVGYMVNFNLVFFYGAPLSTIWTVLQQRQTASIHIPTLVTNTLNASFWLAYGLAVQDAFIYIPNGLGTVLGTIQGVLLLIFPRKATKSNNIHQEDVLPDETNIIINTTDVRDDNNNSSTDAAKGWWWWSCRRKPSNTIKTTTTATTLEVSGRNTGTVQPEVECE